MKVTKDVFNSVLVMSANGGTTQGLAARFGLSERVIRRIKEAKTWNRWPYIQAKAKWGYMTPEYKRYLKRRGLPLVPPKQEPSTYRVTYHMMVKKPWWKRWFK